MKYTNKTTRARYRATTVRRGRGSRAHFTTGRMNSLYSPGGVNAERKRQAAIDAYMDEWMKIRAEELA